MVDRRARVRYAELLRHFATGRVTGAEYERRYEAEFFRTGDAAIPAIHAEVWLVYDIDAMPADERRRLRREARREFARWIMFLYTDQVYAWRTAGVWGLLATLAGWAVSFMSAGLFSVAAWLVHLLTLSCFRSRGGDHAGDARAWPFYRWDDFDEALRHPRLLSGG